jgi:hypothetical protein
MELLFATLGGALIGLGLGYAVPGRANFGALLLPALGASVAAIVFTALTWLGWKFDGGWIWVVSLVASGVITLVVGILISRMRTRGDVEMLGRLSRA